MFLDCEAEGIDVYLHFEMFGETFYKLEGNFIMSHPITSIKTLCVKVHVHAYL